MDYQNYNENNSSNIETPVIPPSIPTGEIPMKPSNWLWQAIAITICCSPIIGIIAIVFASRVNSLYYQGRYEESLRASKKAKMWVIIGIVLGIVFTIIYTIYILSSGDFSQSIDNIINNNASDYNY